MQIQMTALAALSCVAMTTTLCGQALRNLRSEHFAASPSLLLSALDLDGDGDTDLLADGGDRLAIHENVGQLRFDEVGARSAIATLELRAVAPLDVDGDGQPDLAVASQYGLRLFLRRGGIYVDESLRLPAGLPTPSRVVAADVDGDGDVDLVFGGVDGRFRTLRHAGGVFTLDPVTFVVGYPSALIALDANHDGASELLVATAGEVLFVSNDGTGRFVASLLTSNIFASALSVADTDGDGDFDVLATATQGTTPLYHWENLNGSGFIDRTQRLPAPRVPAALGLATLDVDNDGDFDIALGCSDFASEVLLNTRGQFARPSTPLMPALVEVQRLVAADVDLDGRDDLVVQPISRRPEIWKNVGGRLAAIDGAPVPEYTALFADLNGDGDPDAIGHCGAYGTKLFTARNDGSGRCSIDQLVDLPFVFGPILSGDVDGDGDEDVVVFTPASGTAPDMWRQYLNNGTGRLSAGLTQPTNGLASVGRTMADLDGDRDADLLLDDGRLLESTPTGYVSHRITTVQGLGAPPLVVDFNGDGLPDIVFGDSAALKVMVGRGRLNFVDASGIVLNSPRSSVLLAKGSSPTGALALLALSAGAWSTATVHVFDGRNFVPRSSVGMQAVSGGRAIGVDLIEGGGTEWLIRAHDNRNSWNATWSFDLQFVHDYVFGGMGPFDPVAEDLDRDGDADLADINGDMWRGTAGQAHAPLAATLGNEFRVNFLGNGRLTLIALIGAVTVRSPTPWGLLRVDPRQALVVPTSGNALRFPMPNNVALRGLALCVQGVSQGTGLHLTNMERRVIY